VGQNGENESRAAFGDSAGYSAAATYNSLRLPSPSENAALGKDWLCKGYHHGQNGSRQWRLVWGRRAGMSSDTGQKRERGGGGVADRGRRPHLVVEKLKGRHFQVLLLCFHPLVNHSKGKTGVARGLDFWWIGLCAAMFRRTPPSSLQFGKRPLPAHPATRTPALCCWY
jgi:hypothetical protein